MSLLVHTSLNNTEVDENESPLGKRKSESPSTRNSKRSPLSDMKTNHNIRCANVSNQQEKRIATPSKPHLLSTKNSNIYSSSKARHRVTKEEIEATDEGRASVDKLSAWLASESAKKSKKPPQTFVAAPVRFRVKPKISKEDVEATDEKRVSVKTLSAWISDDPFEQKKLRHIRSGAKVITKSRIFEPHDTVTESRKVDVKVGSVSEKQAWLSSAFKQEENQDGRSKGDFPDKSKVISLRQSQNQEKNVESPELALKSVRDKTEWLSNAFKKNDNCLKMTTSFDGINDTPYILKCASRDDTQSPRSQRFISQRASFDGIKNSHEDGMSPVRLYKKSFLESENPDNGPKTVKDKQKWLSNTFKKQSTDNSLIRHTQPTITQTCEEISRRKSLLAPSNTEHELIENPLLNNGNDLVSVADRAKWLRGAFKK